MVKKPKHLEKYLNNPNFKLSYMDAQNKQEFDLWVAKAEEDNRKSNDAGLRQAWEKISQDHPLVPVFQQEFRRRELPIPLTINDLFENKAKIQLVEVGPFSNGQKFKMFRRGASVYVLRKPEFEKFLEAYEKHIETWEKYLKAVNAILSSAKSREDKVTETEDKRKESEAAWNQFSFIYGNVLLKLRDCPVKNVGALAIPFFNPIYFQAKKSRPFFWEFVRLAQREYHAKSGKLTPGPTGSRTMTPEQEKKYFELKSKGLPDAKIIEKIWPKEFKNSDVGDPIPKLKMRISRLRKRRSAQQQ